MTAINAFDYRAELDELGPEILRAVERVMRSGWLILGPEVERFENSLAETLGGGHGIGVANGTDAITAALMALGIGPGDEVITVPNTATATANAIARAGATIVFCDVDPSTALLDIAQARALVSARTKAIVPVHLYGNAVDVPGLLDILDGTGVAVVEDCAQALGTTLDGVPVGTFGAIGTFSFYPTKNLGAYGDGGLCFTKSKQLADTLRQVRRYGFEQRDYAVRSGMNSRLDELQAAILSVKLPHLSRNVQKRRALATIYDELLPQVGITRLVTTPSCSHGRHLYPIRLERRDHVARELKRRDIETGVHYPHPIHRMPAFATTRVPELPNAERLSREVLSLPIHPGLEPADVQRVCSALTEVLTQGS
jgi:dTDP-3-amino-2,3,6-trideoxy-4-keto-D-glucose/dTDP-3-amino-3,4,6-trideoxy-alpha-D-glucose/dTDP-2,6-dideoxy-D-kanosamine transaminase